MHIIEEAVRISKTLWNRFFQRFSKKILLFSDSKCRMQLYPAVTYRPASRRIKHAQRIAR